MARLSLTGTKKFKLLCGALNLPRPYVRGLLDTMWDSCHESADPVLGNAAAVEIAAEWPGEPGVFSKALVDAGFLDTREDGLLECHDYWENCPRYVKRRVERRRQERVDAARYIEEVGAQRAPSGRPVAGQRAPNGRPMVDPLPVPSLSRPDISLRSDSEEESKGEPAGQPDRSTGDPEPGGGTGEPRRHTNPPSETDLLLDDMTEKLNILEGIRDSREREDRGALLTIARHVPRSIVQLALADTVDADLRHKAGQGDAVHAARYFTARVRLRCLAGRIGSPFGKATEPAASGTTAGGKP